MVYSISIGEVQNIMSDRVKVSPHFKTSCNGTRFHVRGQVRASPSSKSTSK